jgi:CRP-like cAMP-binding protein
MLDTKVRTAPIAASPLSRCLDSFQPLEIDDIRQVEGALGSMRLQRSGGTIRAEDEIPADGLLAVSDGWAAAVAMLEDGRRQIVDLLLPGDIADLAELRKESLGLVALTRVRVQRIEGPVAGLSRVGGPGRLGRAWRLKCEADHKRIVHHIVRLGRMPAYQRVADFLIEQQERQRRYSRTARDVIELPLTQDMLADHLGMSVVHVNRVLQHLRRDGLIAYRNGHMAIRDAGRLSRHAWRSG